MPRFPRLALPAGLLVGLALVPLQVMGPSLRRVPGDLVDARFNNYVLEHGYRWLTGREAQLPSPADGIYLGLLSFYEGPPKSAPAFSNALVVIDKGPVPPPEPSWQRSPGQNRLPQPPAPRTPQLQI